MIEEEYQEVKQKYSLPEFTQLEDEFDLLLAESEYPLKAIRKQMEEKLDFLAEILGDILQPSPDSFPQMHECEYILDNDKNIVLEVYKEIKFLTRSINESQLENNEQKNAELIKIIAHRWPELKNKALPIVSKLKHSWKKQVSPSERLGYFG